MLTTLSKKTQADNGMSIAMTVTLGVTFGVFYLGFGLIVAYFVLETPPSYLRFASHPHSYCRQLLKAVVVCFITLIWPAVIAYRCAWNLAFVAWRRIVAQPRSTPVTRAARGLCAVLRGTAYDADCASAMNRVENARRARLIGSQLQPIELSAYEQPLPAAHQATTSARETIQHPTPASLTGLSDDGDDDMSAMPHSVLPPMPSNSPALSIASTDSSRTLLPTAPRPAHFMNRWTAQPALGRAASTSSSVSTPSVSEVPGLTPAVSHSLFDSDVATLVDGERRGTPQSWRSFLGRVRQDRPGDDEMV